MTISSPSQPIDRKHPVPVHIRRRFLLTQGNSTKITFHVSLNITDSGLCFKVGDSVGVFAQNDPLLVSHLIAAMKATGKEIILDPRSNQEMTLERFLSTKANLSRITSSFLKLFYEYEPLHDKKNHLRHLLQQDNKPLLSQYLGTHDPLDLFKEYHDTKIPLQELCAQFGPLLPRFYSIASSPLAYPDRVDLTVALFTFTHSGGLRFGVASHFLCQMAQEKTTAIPVYIQPSHGFTLPQDDATPIIMIGPGTGIAPFRAFLQERMARNASGKNWLFFGERNQSTDFFYKQEWEALSQANKLQMELAFSRDQPEKIYVQHRMLQHAKELWRWLQEGAYFYVCGDAHKMAKDVEAALIHIAAQEGGLTDEAAKAYIKTLRSEKRYLADVY